MTGAADTLAPVADSPSVDLEALYTGSGIGEMLRRWTANWSG